MNLPSIFNYLPEHAAELCKLAEEKKDHPAKSIAKTVGSGLLGFAGGSLAGAGTMHLLDKWHQVATGGERIPIGALYKAAPVIGGALGLTYNLYKARELEELRNALSTQHDRSQGRVPGE